MTVSLVKPAPTQGKGVAVSVAQPGGGPATHTLPALVGAMGVALLGWAVWAGHVWAGLVVAAVALVAWRVAGEVRLRRRVEARFADQVKINTVTRSGTRTPSLPGQEAA